jgi:hypothetical protein
MPRWGKESKVEDTSSEVFIRTQCKRWLEAQGWRVDKMWQGQFGIKGQPDLLCISPTGRFVWVEVKSPTGKLSEAQVKYHDDMYKREVECYTVSSLDSLITQIEGGKV